MRFYFVILLSPCSVFALVHQTGHLLGCEDLSEFPTGSYENVEIINFSKNNFVKLTLNIFDNHRFFSLKKAILRSNNIAEVEPDAFASMSKISYLDLYGNKLTVFHKNSFKGLDSLKKLLLVNNRIETIEGEVLKPLPMLEKLDLSYNQISKLDKTLLKHTSVIDVNLSNNPVKFTEHETILESSSLTALSLQGCNLTSLPTKSFTKLLKLKYLNLSRNKLKVLSKGLLKPLESLEVLDISHNSITQVELYLPTNLKALRCMGNPLEDTISCDKILGFLREAEWSKETSLQPVTFETNQDKNVGRKDVQIKNEENDFSTMTVNEEERNTIGKPSIFLTLVPKNKQKYEDVQRKLMFAILGGCVLFVILLLILFAQIYYIVVVMDKSSSDSCRLTETA